MKYKLSEINLSQNGKIHVPDIMHFVWVGDKSQVNAEYISIWKKTNKDKEMYFWCDEYVSLCDSFHNSIREYVIYNDFETKSHAEMHIKNKAFDYMFPKLKEGFVFDELVMSFLSENNIPYHELTRSALNQGIKNTGVIAKNIAELFTSEFADFKRYYYYEIILRGNLASASDIVRLLIIYRYGGIYMDMDTLPYTDNIFKRLNEFINNEKIVENDFLYLFKTKSILKKVSLLEFSDDEYLNHYKDEIGTTYQEIQKLIELDVADFSLRKVLPLGEMYVHKNLLSIGSLRRLKGIYFNNFIVSHVRSKAVRIILRTMRKRYHFLEKNNCIFNFYSGGAPPCYLARILTWRTELITKDYCVTSVLTGPGLIVEVLLGLAYELLDLGNITTPSSVAEYMQNDTFGIALFQHNIDTPEGVYSTWRK